MIVLSNNDGCAVARSNEAKALGIKMGAPVFQIQDLIHHHHVQVLSSNYALYGDLSNRVMQTLQTFTPDVEVYSIDEAFLGLTGTVSKNSMALLRATVYRWTGIPVSIGVATTKTLAKIANHQAKQSDGICLLDEPATLLADLPVSDVWGIGRRSTQKLQARGITTALDLQQTDLRWIRQQLGIVGVRIVQELEGIPCLPLELIPQPRKTCCVSRSFGQSVTELQDLSEAIAAHTARAAYKLRRDQLTTALLTVFIATNRFNKAEPYYRNAATVGLPYPTNDTLTLTKAALQALAPLYRAGHHYQKAGLWLSDLSPAQQIQQDLFLNPHTQAKAQRLMTVMDALNQQFGAGTLRCAAEGLQQPWRTRVQRRSPRYTTQWDELLQVL